MATIIKPLTPSVVDLIVRGHDPAGTFIRDPKLIGFAVRTGSTRSSFVVEARAGRSGKTVRQTIGTVGKIKLDEAKTQGREALAKCALSRRRRRTLWIAPCARSKLPHTILPSST